MLANIFAGGNYRQESKYNWLFKIIYNFTY